MALLGWLGNDSMRGGVLRERWTRDEPNPVRRRISARTTITTANRDNRRRLL